MTRTRTHAKAGWQGKVAAELTRTVLARAGGRCQVAIPGVCIGSATVADHIRPIALGGAALDLANLRAACRPCNEKLSGEFGAVNARQRAQRLRELESQFGHLVPRSAPFGSTIERPAMNDCTPEQLVEHGYWSRAW